MAGTSKYERLGKYLANSGLERVRLTYEKLGELCSLPQTAYIDRSFWANTWASQRAHSWLEVGYVVDEVSSGNFVVFRHDFGRAKDPGAGRKKGCAPVKGSHGKANPEILRPCPEELEKYLQTWEKLEKYPEQEAALDELFLKHCPKNETLSDVLLKATVLNDFYSTNIFSIMPVARHILSLNIDDRLAGGDLTLVEDIQRVKFKEKEKDFYSFASKYCSHHKPLVFPIYDSYVDKMLCYFRNMDGLIMFQNNELKDYSRFMEVLTQFQEAYGLEKYSIKAVDKYLWQLGKTYFPNKYGKRK